MPKVYHTAQSVVQLPLFVSSKRCSGCKEEHPADRFTRDSYKKDGLCNYCKDCTRKRDVIRYKAKPRKEKVIREKPLQKKTPVVATRAGFKICTHCHTEKSFEDFYKSPKNSYGLTPMCKSCLGERKLAISRRISPPQSQVCKACQVEKNIDEFYKSRWSPNGYTIRCKICLDSKDATHGVVNRRRDKRNIVTPPEHKYCTGCKNTKPLEDFPVDITKKDGKRTRCRDCQTAFAKQKYHKNREKNIVEQRERYNTPQSLETRRAYAQSHGLQFREKNMKRLAIKKLATIGEVSLERILERDGMWCYLCEQDILTHHKLHFDHIVPLSRGGAHSEANIKPTHQVCNNRKLNKFLEELTDFDRRGPDIA